MKLFISVCIFIFGFIFVGLESSQSEPWLSNRYAQNCAACHAPSRNNLPTKDRRCTLSCQGCHTNPNGGGLRNQYGKWNSDRWLRSYHWKVQGREKERPLPWFAQSYISEKQARKVISALSGKNPKDRLHPKVVPNSEAEQKLLAAAIKSTKKLRDKKSRRTFTQSHFPAHEFSEFFYERANGDDNWDPIATSKKQFESTIPRDDPYFRKKRESVLVGMDFRYMGLTEIDNTNNTDENYFWPMTFDVGVQVKPFLHKWDNVSLVVETRYQNSPANEDLDYATTSGVKNRSTYVLIDDLPYNAFIMHGFYKPMFEHYTPDHTSLAQGILYRMRGYEVVNKALSIGLAPNVPFANFHLIQPMTNTSLNQEEGFAANLGARWVTLGASLVYSYRSTDIEDVATSQKLNTTAHSIHGGMTWLDFIFNGEVLNITREFASGATHSGSIFTSELRYRLWRESYVELVAEMSNVTAATGNLEALTKGEATQLSFGYRIFPVAGMNFSVHYRKVKNTQADPTPATTVEATEGLVQAHLFF